VETAVGALQAASSSISAAGTIRIVIWVVFVFVFMVSFSFRCDHIADLEKLHQPSGGFVPVHKDRRAAVKKALIIVSGKWMFAILISEGSNILEQAGYPGLMLHVRSGEPHLRF
jgi:hypothetical protein